MSWSGSGLAGYGGSDSPSSSSPDPISSAANTFLSDTVGAVWRGLSGSVDPWTNAEIVDSNASAMVQASDGTLSYDDAAAQISQTVSDVQSGQNVSWSDAAKAWTKQAFNDDGSGCSLITNPAGCYPSWLPYAAIAAGLLLLLWVLRPYVMAAEE